MKNLNKYIDHTNLKPMTTRYAPMRVLGILLPYVSIPVIFRLQKSF